MCAPPFTPKTICKDVTHACPQGLRSHRTLTGHGDPALHCRWTGRNKARSLGHGGSPLSLTLPVFATVLVLVCFETGSHVSQAGLTFLT